MRVTGCGQECLEVTVGDDGMVLIRESDAPEAIVVTTPAKWDAFVKSVKAGEFDAYGEEPAPSTY
nr:MULTISPECIES: DUF397 domain-containing protein [unclassified Streptomyces]